MHAGSESKKTQKTEVALSLCLQAKRLHMATRIPEVLYAFRVDQSVAVCPPQGMQVLSTSSPCRRHSDRSPRHSGREAEGDAEWSPSAALQADRLDAGRPDFRFYFGMSYAHYPLTYHCV